MLPFWRQRSTHVCPTLRTHFNSAGVMRSVDQGRTWQAHGDLKLPGGRNKWVIEGTVVELGRGLHSFPFQHKLSSSVHRIAQLNS